MHLRLSKKSKILFLVIWLHITLLDLFYINHNGFVFLWQENREFKTLFTHLLIATLTVIFYLLVNKWYLCGKKLYLPTDGTDKKL
jgi:hypothetical protein